jgi:hypothetical protein
MAQVLRILWLNTRNSLPRLLTQNHRCFLQQQCVCGSSQAGLSQMAARPVAQKGDTAMTKHS